MSDNMNRFVNDETGQMRKSYIEWLQLPTTQMVIGILEEINRPGLPPAGDMNGMALAHALQCGKWEIIRQLQALDAILETVEEESGPTYGAPEISAEWNKERGIGNGKRTPGRTGRKAQHQTADAGQG